MRTPTSLEMCIAMSTALEAQKGAVFDQLITVLRQFQGFPLTDRKDSGYPEGDQEDGQGENDEIRRVGRSPS
jgi:hypothetical protein